MKKSLAVSLLLLLTGCACGRKATELQLRQALTDTNAALTQCRTQNQLLQEQGVRLARRMELYKKHRR